MQGIEVWSLDPWMSMLPNRAISLIIGDDEYDVGLCAKRQILGNQSQAGYKKRKG